MAIKHRYILINEQGCVFDEGMFSNIKDAKSWARGRNGTYKLIREFDDIHIPERVWVVKNNRVFDMEG